MEEEQLAAAAVAWALARVGHQSHALRCLAFVEDAYERSSSIEVFGGASATESAELYGVLPYDPAQPPPPGSLVFYACTGPIEAEVRDWGHVGLALGDGRVVHAWDTVRVDDAFAIEHLDPAPGWDQPRLTGWVPAARLLQGHRRREWADA